MKSRDPCLPIPRLLSTRSHKAGEMHHQKEIKNFQLLDGVLHYKGKGGFLWQVSSITIGE